jgi:hypothetical protein
VFRALRNIEKAAGGTPLLRITRNGIGPNTKYLFKALSMADAKTIAAAEKEFKSFAEREGLGATTSDPLDFLEEVKV